MKWNLNIEDAWYSTQVDENTEKGVVEFGVKERTGKRFSLGTITLDFNELYLKKRVTRKNKAYRVNIYFDRPDFYISQTRDDRNRHYIGLKYPNNIEANLNGRSQ